MDAYWLEGELKIGVKALVGNTCLCANSVNIGGTSPARNIAIVSFGISDIEAHPDIACQLTIITPVKAVFLIDERQRRLPELVFPKVANLVTVD